MGMYNFYAEEIVDRGLHKGFRHCIFVSTDSVEEAIEVVKDDMKKRIVNPDEVFNNPDNMFKPSSIHSDTIAERMKRNNSYRASIILTKIINLLDKGITSQYVVYIYTDRDIIERREVSDIWSFKILNSRRFEISDYKEEAGTLFALDDVVRIKNDHSNIKYKVTKVPIKSLFWENLYGIKAINSKSDKYREYISLVHESELEKVKEDK